jgi:hypothetical protein
MPSALEREIELLKDFQHENIVQYLYSFSRPLKQASLTETRQIRHWKVIS